MPEGTSGESEVDPTETVGPLPTDAALTDAQLRDLAEILYKMVLDELRVERERLGR